MRATMNTLALLLLVLAATAAFVSAQNADCPEAYGWHPNPDNCIKYYRCENYTRIDYTCKEDLDTGEQLLYDEENTLCERHANVNCGNRPVCNEFDEECYMQSTTTPAPTYPPIDFDCPEAYGYYADPDNCIYYIRCEQSVARRVLCGEDSDFPGQHMLYDEAAEACDHHDRVNCGDRPICDEFDQACYLQSTTTPAPTYPPIDFDCPDNGGTTTTLHADPTNCIFYISCYAGVAERVLCPTQEGQQLHYHPDNEWCDYPDNVYCGDRPICDQFDENCSDPEATTTEDPDAYKCPEPNGYFYDPENCIKYYHCLNNKATRTTCPIASGIREYWSQTSVNDGYCDWPDRVVCGDRPVCNDADEECFIQPPPPTTTPPPPNPCEHETIDCSAGDGWHELPGAGECETCMCECANGYPWHFCCAGGAFWDPETENCVDKPHC